MLLHNRHFRLLTTLLACSCSSLLFAATPPNVPDIPMTYVKGGCFAMGDQFGDGAADERPVHEVCVDDFYFGTFEVTEGQWQALMNDTPLTSRRGANYPAAGVSWKDAREFSKRLNERTGRHYRLPTEAEWEYAAKGGGKRQKYVGSDNETALATTAWYGANSDNTRHPVGQKQPNELGLYDLNGNVWEWVSDRYDAFYYRQSPRQNPTGDPFGVNRILRGGAYDSTSSRLRTSYRDYVAPEVRSENIGFRLLLQAR
jgi:formylglycine-generating enzyme required for sulfatase activity